MGTRRARGQVFGEVADAYDRVRPVYPSALLDDVLDFAGAGAAALEVGAGTGKATVAFADRGVRVTAVEPDPAMAAVLSRHVAGRPQVTVAVCTFERYRPPAPFGLLYSAQAWHWTDPAVRWQRAAAALAPGGAVALFWNDYHLADPRQRRAEREVLGQHLPPDMAGEAARTTRPWPCLELAGRTEFGRLVEREYRWDWIVPAADYLTLLSSHSMYRLLDPPVRDGLFAALAGRLGDPVALEGSTLLYLTRRTAA